jgi:hypothetical protein
MKYQDRKYTFKCMIGKCKSEIEEKGAKMVSKSYLRHVATEHATIKEGVLSFACLEFDVEGIGNKKTYTLGRCDIKDRVHECNGDIWCALCGWRTTQGTLKKRRDYISRHYDIHHAIPVPIERRTVYEGLDVVAELGSTSLMVKAGDETRGILRCELCLKDKVCQVGNTNDPTHTSKCTKHLGERIYFEGVGWVNLHDPSQTKWYREFYNMLQMPPQAELKLKVSGKYAYRFQLDGITWLTKSCHCGKPNVMAGIYGKEGCAEHYKTSLKQCCAMPRVIRSVVRRRENLRVMISSSRS